MGDSSTDLIGTPALFGVAHRARSIAGDIAAASHAGPRQRLPALQRPQAGFHDIEITMPEHSDPGSIALTRAFAAGT